MPHRVTFAGAEASSSSCTAALPSAVSEALRMHTSCPHGARRLTRDSWVSVGSLAIPGIVVSLEIPVFPIFLVNISGKIVKIDFLDSRDKIIF